jgi:hypothetical protein
MTVLVRTRTRAIKALFLYIGALALLAVLMSTEVWWLDAAYVGIGFALLLAFSARTLFSKWRSDGTRDVTKHGPGAAYPDGWRRWLTDDYPEAKPRAER